MLAIVLRSAPRAAEALPPLAALTPPQGAAHVRRCGVKRRAQRCRTPRCRLATAEATAMHFLFEAFPSSFPHYFVMDTYLVIISDTFLRIQTFKNCGTAVIR